MRQLIYVSFFIFSIFAQAEVVKLKISNLGGESGQVAIAVFDDPDSFPERSQKAIVKKYVPVNAQANEMELMIELKPGRYALAAFLDHNNNQHLDTNLVGAPKERFGFSMNPKINFSAPNFAECAFEVESQKSNQQIIRLIKFF